MQNRQQVFIGSNAIVDFKQLLQEWHPKKILLFRDKKSFDLCGAKLIVDNLAKELKFKVIEFFDFSENPKFEDMERGLSFLSRINIDFIIAVGGGSVLDMAKLIRFFFSYSGDFRNSEFTKEKELIPLIALPTTAGTGSEATHFAVLYKEKLKYSVAHKDMLPNVAVVYPPFTYSTPKYLTASTGFDALAQAIEAYWNINATPESDEYSIKAIKLLWSYLLDTVIAPSDNAKNKIAEGAYWAGRAINITKTTAPHAISYAFTSYYGFSHGHAVALTFPFFAEYNTNIPVSEYKGIIPLEKYRNKMEWLFFELNVRKEEGICNTIKSYIQKLGLSFCLPDNFDRNIIIKNINIQRVQNNPRLITEDILNKIVDSLLVVDK